LRGEGKGEGEERSSLAAPPTGVQFIPVTEDGSMGKKGMATDILPDYLDWADQVYACGPVDMYKAMALTLNPSTLKGEGKSEGEKQSNLKLRKCQVSLEVRMGCGFGACYSCTINTKKGLKQVCRDGPVFELNDIIWQEVRI
jgi:dihydroorotate dehydrogenase electron transfer subunit